jgi:hypothetical protein
MKVSVYWLQVVFKIILQLLFWKKKILWNQDTYSYTSICEKYYFSKYNILLWF